MLIYKDDPLFAAILSNDIERIMQLKSQGAALSDEVKNTLSINRLSAPVDEDTLWAITFDFQCEVRPKSAADFIMTIRTLRDEIGAPLFFIPAIWPDIKSIMFEEGVWECVLDCFDHKMNKARTMRDIIKRDRADILAICAEHDWLSQPKKRDDMIEYASANGKTECEAFLLDFKSRTADLASERAKAETKLERELNAAPDSVTALKQIWSYKKQDDGSLMITGYKGGSTTEVTVPERIGKDIVTAIGDSAFCPFAAKIKPEVKEVRKAITKITLPDTVRSIGRAAFWDCELLVSVNIPDGVEKIGENTFAECCKLEKIVIPNSVKKIEKRAFFRCDSLKFIVVPEGVEAIGESAFAVCRKLEKIVIPNSVKKIEKCAFFQCDSLKFIVVPEGVEAIGESVFAMCKELITLVLPGSLKFIGSVIISTEYVSLVGVVVPRGSIAEDYCKRKSIPFANKLTEVSPGSSAEEYCILHHTPYICKEDNN